MIMTQCLYRTFPDLPEWAKSRIHLIAPKDAETWIYEPVPALDNQSFIDLMNQGEDGRNTLRRYLNTVMGKFFQEYDNDKY